MTDPIQLAAKFAHIVYIPQGLYTFNKQGIAALISRVREEAIRECAEVCKGATAYTQFQSVNHYKFASFIESKIRTLLEQSGAERK